MRVLFIGDVVGRPGRAAVRALLKGLVARYEVDFALANAENAAGGLGLNRATAAELLGAGLQVLTTGNHIWRQKEAALLVEEEPRVLRPANYPPACPGRGAAVFRTAGGVPVAVINLIGRVFMDPLDCPFRTVDEELGPLQERAKVVLVDVHAEATSEKVALGWYLDGRASMVLGTHTHVPTSDERILPRGTAYITDVGMTGPREGVLGVATEPVVARFLTGMPRHFEVAPGPTILNAVVVEVDESTGTARSIQRIVEVFQKER